MKLNAQHGQIVSNPIVTIIRQAQVQLEADLALSVRAKCVRPAEQLRWTTIGPSEVQATSRATNVAHYFGPSEVCATSRAT